ncbi:MAG: NAD-dependent epimerase/dehydratase family protein [Planctomycetes bacterium]|nr:NAD-dependent epimerase/dehydratase family protein [Planctomycetota bacterium]
MHILVTGSSGQIGTNVGLALLERGDRVTGIDKRANAWTDEIETVQMNLATANVDEIPTGPFDAVLHLAANAKVFELVEQPDRAMDNVKTLFNVLEFCRRNKTPIIFASSREVYGDIHHHVTHEDLADFVVAESPYSASKIAGEAFVYSYNQCYGLPYLVFRFSNVYGRFDNDAERMERVTPLFIDRINSEAPITVFGKQKVLDFTYVDDCVTGVLSGIDKLVAGDVGNQTINLAYGQGWTLVDLVNLIGLGLRKEPKVTYEPSRSGEVMRYVADIGKARELLDYDPQTPLSAGIPKTLAWWRESGALA